MWTKKLLAGVRLGVLARSGCEGASWYAEMFVDFGDLCFWVRAT
jgi:hypothetical protein